MGIALRDFRGYRMGRNGWCSEPNLREFSESGFTGWGGFTGLFVQLSDTMTVVPDGAIDTPTHPGNPLIL